MNKFLSKITASPCNLETRALCLGAWMVKISLNLFASKEISNQFVAELFATQDKNVMFTYAERIHMPKILLRSVVVMNDIFAKSVTTLFKVA